MDYSPLVLMDRLSTKLGNVVVVRDDILKGGTKQRAAIPFLSFHKKNIDEFVYASPFSGFAQIALSVSGNLVGAKTTIFAGVDPITNEQSAFTKIASEFSNIHLCKNLEEAEHESEKYCNETGKMKIPLGFNDNLFRYYLQKELSKQWRYICSQLGYIPSNIWLPVGSGTLVNTFRSVIPKSVKITCVDVRVLQSNDIRIYNIKNLCNVEYKLAKELFVEKCYQIPPIPSNSYYDAKLWGYVYNFACNNDIWWNVAA